MKKTGINQYVIGDPFEGFMLIKEARKGTASNGKAILTLFFTNSTVKIDDKLWDSIQEVEETFDTGEVVKIKGDINEFRGKAQMRIKSIRPAQVTDGVRVSDFLQKAPLSQEKLQVLMT